MKSLWILTKKNLKLLIRSKSSALVIFFAPLLIILILGLSYNTSSTYGLNIGVIAPSFSDDVNSLISSLQEEFKVVKYESSGECVDDIKSGFVHTCVFLPEKLSVEENQQKEVKFFIDPSKIHLVWMIQETLSEEFNLISQQTSQEITQNILTELSETKTKVNAHSERLNDVKEKSSSASSSAESISSNLNSLNLGAPMQLYDTTVVDIFKGNISSEISNSLSQVAEAKEAVDNANISGGSITSALNKADDSLNKALNLINGTGTGSLKDVSSLVENLDLDLRTVQNKLLDLSEEISSSTSGLSLTSAAIKESITSIENVQAGLAEIKTSIDSQKVTEADVVASPIKLEVERVAPEGSYLNYMFPALLVLVIMFSSLLLGTTLVMMEKNSPAFFRNYFVPLKKGSFIISTFLTNSVITLVQIAVILGVSVFFLKESLVSLLPIGLVLLISSSVFSFVGMSIGYLFKSDETGTLASISTGSLLLFLSGVVLPLESVSVAVRKTANFNPFVISEKIIRELFLFNSSFNLVVGDLITLLSYTVGLFLLILVIESSVHKHHKHYFLKRHHKLHREKDKKNKDV